MLELPPLSLYIHIPWCVQKCPYCDFNSHALKQGLPEQEYIGHLLNDLEADLPLTSGREISTIFIGGGTPSLFSAEGMQQLLDGVRARIAVAADAEITMEANPGTVEADRFTGYQQAGINRISIGVQSFAADKLQRL
ncbi:MAG: radical SAM protein, partial [Plesiomonas shigelloides]